MSCRIDQYSVLIESSSTSVCANMGVSLTNLSREGKCIKFQSSVYLIYQRLARKAVQDQDELHEDEDDQDQVQEGDRARWR